MRLLPDFVMRGEVLKMHRRMMRRVMTAFRRDGDGLLELSRLVDGGATRALLVRLSIRAVTIPELYRIAQRMGMPMTDLFYASDDQISPL